MSDARFGWGGMMTAIGTADVVIVGGGQAGPATAWALRRLDPTLRVTLVEAGVTLGEGASTASMENFRTCWTPRAIAEQMRRSMEVFFNADEYLGAGAAAGLNLRQRGYLWLAFDEGEAAAHRATVELLRGWGIAHAEYLEQADLRREYPWLPRHLVGARRDPVAGWMDSRFLAQRFAEVSGATVMRETTATRVLATGGRITGVETSHGRVDAGAVVLAAGPATRGLGRTAGIDIPVVCVPRQSFWSPHRGAEIPANAPLVIGHMTAPHFRPEGAGTLFSWAYGWLSRDRRGERARWLEEPRGPAAAERDARFPSATLVALARQLGHREGEGFLDPRYLRRGLSHGAGYYVYRGPLRDAAGALFLSERAILDRWPEVEGLFLSVGHAGHGIMTAPAAAEVVAALVMGREPRLPHAQDFRLGVEEVEHERGSGL